MLNIYLTAICKTHELFFPVIEANNTSYRTGFSIVEFLNAVALSPESLILSPHGPNTYSRNVPTMTLCLAFLH
jgi:hypothetical protein